MAMEERDFDVIIDCTGFTAMSEIPLLWFKIFLELVPADIVARFSRCFILNANNAAAKFFRKLYHICGGLDSIILVLCHSHQASQVKPWRRRLMPSLR